MTYPYTQSTVVGKTGKNKTGIALSTHILIKTGEGIPVGAVKTLSITEASQIETIKEVGTDGVIDSCRKSAVGITGNCTRIRFDRMRITEAFGRSFIHLASQAYPLDIHLYDRQAANSADWIVTVVKNVWFSNLVINYNADDFIISDTAQFTAETIYSYLLGNNAPAATGGVRGASQLYDVGLSNDTTGGLSIERATDVGKNNRRGSLDVSGLVSLGE